MKPNQPPTFQFIDQPELVDKMVCHLERQKIIAVDLEADSMYHYTEKVCLLQIASKQRKFIVDPLTLKDLSPLKPLFVDRNIQKIFHGADYDVRSLYRDFRIRINNLFDTQIASRFLGLNETGLNAVVADRFNVQLDKKYRKKDWTQRPLPDQMLSYAASDVIFLIPLAAMLKSELEKIGRLGWVADECDMLSRVRPAINSDEPLFIRFKGAGRLSPRELAVLEAVLKLRNTLAAEKDRPPFKIFGNTAIEKIIQQKPVKLNQLKKIKALSTKQLGCYGKMIVRTVHDAMDIPENRLVAYPRQQKPIMKIAARKRVKALREWRDKLALSLKLEPALICSRSVITEIARQNPVNLAQLKRIGELKGWQKNQFGSDMLDVLKKCDGRKT